MSQDNRRPTMDGREFRRIRETLNLSRDAFAIELGYEGNANGNRNTIKRFETNERPISLPVAKLVWLLGQHGLPTAWPSGLEAQVTEARSAVEAAMSQAGDVAQSPTDEQVETACVAYAKATGYYVEFHRGLSSVSLDRIRAGMRAALSAVSSTDRCAKCGHPRDEHSYNGACYGLCGEFVSSVPSTDGKTP